MAVIQMRRTKIEFFFPNKTNNQQASPLVLLGGATLGILKGRGSLQDIDQQVSYILFENNCVIRLLTVVVSRSSEMANNGVPRGRHYSNTRQSFSYRKKWCSRTGT